MKKVLLKANSTHRRLKAATQAAAAGYILFFSV
jgi:hypothetical protein